MHFRFTYAELKRHIIPCSKLALHKNHILTHLKNSISFLKKFISVFSLKLS